jgi:EAL domain-containing protein (putative c-di-GMP-specific phosphodiesterase class I)
LIAFVKELGSRIEMRAMIQSLVTLAHQLNMQVVVEGIETFEQLEMIKLLGGNQAQGFPLGRPTADFMSHFRSGTPEAQSNAANSMEKTLVEPGVRPRVSVVLPQLAKLSAILDLPQ